MSPQAIMSALFLKLMQNSLEVTLADCPSVIFRDFGEYAHLKNFCDGEIWFSGPSQNRFFLENEERRD